MSYSVGESVTGVVSGIADYGAFVRLPDGTTGMIHISKLSSEYIGDIRSVIKKDDVVTATVISSTQGRIALSMIGDGVKKKKRTTDYHRENPPMDFESMLSCFKSESEERLSCLPRGSRVCERKRRK